MDQFFEHMKEAKSTRALAQTLGKGIQLFPKEIKMWAAAPPYERSNGNWSSARTLLLRAIRLNSKDESFYAEYVRFELDFVAMLEGRRRALGLDTTRVEDDANPDVSIKAPANGDGDGDGDGGDDDDDDEMEGQKTGADPLKGSIAIAAYDRCVVMCGGQDDIYCHAKMLEVVTRKKDEIQRTASKDS